MMDANEYQLLARRTQKEELSRIEKRLHALHGIASEVGEIHSIFQHELQHKGEVFDYANLKGEIGDLLWFIAELCDVYYWTLDEVMTGNIEKLKKRYPQGFSEERSIHRHEIDLSESAEE